MLIRSADSNPSACLTDLELMAILEGTLLLRREERAEAHLDSCIRCRSLLVALLHTDDRTAGSA